MAESRRALSQALMEKAVYDSEGQLLSASLMDYCLPRADTPDRFRDPQCAVDQSDGLKGRSRHDRLDPGGGHRSPTPFGAPMASPTSTCRDPQATSRAIRKAETAKRACGE